ncbi:beta-L-arabinofuranosidase domain-containing protein [Actinopolymorpha sp. B11F2]|uniref:beta-L-arabinofuranosidase domain-containing protein n=1 Tax=Actinopolymorpha sp. B11F2 TaxID=3160862 RepID=UPI0032E40DD5
MTPHERQRGRATGVLERPSFADVTLGEGVLHERCALNLTYLESLRPENLLRPYLFEAGLWSWSGTLEPTAGSAAPAGPQTWHWGWEAPTSELRGHILGHWLSAAAQLRHQRPRLDATADLIVAELARCQGSNGGGWIAPFPEKYLERIAAGHRVWAPQYVIHKLLAGLLDMATLGGNETAFEIVRAAANWFDSWTGRFSREQLDDILDWETGGMLEVWAGLYGLTGESTHLALIERYRRGRFFEPLLAGEDVLTNKHANTQIAEILGCARAYEVTGDVEWRRIVEAFWDQAIISRGTYITGGSSSAEIWQPAFQQAARLQDVQEHCTVFNMMRVADYLYRWTGESEYAAYWERNLINGVLAQQNRQTGMVAYFLPLEAGSHKRWGHPTHDFWCCHGTLMQAHASYLGAGIHLDGADLRLGQYVPATATLTTPAGRVEITISPDPRSGLVFGQRRTDEGYQGIQHLHVPPAPAERPSTSLIRIRVRTERPATFAVKLRVPDWAVSTPTLTIDGQGVARNQDGDFLIVRRRWSDETIEVGFTSELKAHPLPGQPGCVAFTDGPVVLAGLVEEERVLVADVHNPEAVLRPDRERGHSWWSAHTHRTQGQDRGFRFIPLHEVTDQTYSIYFPIRPA